MLLSLLIFLFLLSLYLLLIVSQYFAYPDNKLVIKTLFDFIVNTDRTLVCTWASGFVIALLSSKRQFKLLNKTKINKNLSNLTWREFESLSEEFFKKKGYRTILKGGSGGDDGIDIEVYRENKKYIVQCKHWKEKSVGVAIVREMFGVMIDQKADGVKIVTSSRFTKKAYLFINGKPIELISGQELLEQINQLHY